MRQSVRGKNRVRAEADNPLALDFCKHLHGKKVHQEMQHRLYMRDVDWQFVEAWLEEGKISRYNRGVFQGMSRKRFKGVLQHLHGNHQPASHR